MKNRHNIITDIGVESLLQKTPFLKRNGVFEDKFLPNPSIVLQRDVSMPRLAVYHYLDLTNDNKFPNRNAYYLKSSADTKKIPISFVTEMTRVEGTAKTLQNKFINRDIREWLRSHKKGFIISDFDRKPNRDVSMISIVNYNLLKDKHEYRSNAYTFLNYHYNIMETYITNVVEHVKKDRESIHIVPLNLPEYIPGNTMMMIQIGYEGRKLTDTVSEFGELWIMEYYKWLESPTGRIHNGIEGDEENDPDDDKDADVTGEGGKRDNSYFKLITDDLSKNIVIEWKYRGYSCFIPMSIFRGLCNETDIPSTKKMSPIRTKKFFLGFLIKLQRFIQGMSAAQIEDSRTLMSDVDPEDYVSDEAEDQAIDEVITTDTMDRLEMDEDGNVEITEREQKPVKLTRFQERKLDREKELVRIESLDDVFVGVSEDPEGMKNFFTDIEDLDSHGLNPDRTNKTGLVKSATIPVAKVKEDLATTVEEPEVEEEPIELTKELDEHTINELLREPTPDEIVERHIETLEQSGSVSAGEIRSIQSRQAKRKRLTSPYTGKQIDEETSLNLPKIELNDALVELELDIDEVIVPMNLRKNKIKKFDKEYVKNYLKTDVVSSVLGIEEAGIIVNDYTVERVQSSVDKYELHRLSVTPLEGKASTVYFRIPIIDEEGTYMVGGKKYRMRKMRQDLPIRKISPTRVGLTSNYPSKLFVLRSPRRAYDRAFYITNFITSDYLEGAETVKRVVTGKKRLNNEKNLPSTYYLLASEFDRVELVDLILEFNRAEIEKTVPEETLKKIQKQGNVYLGYLRKNSTALVMDQNNQVINFNTGESLGEIEDILGLDRSKVPRPFSAIKLIRDDIPLVVGMSYYFGLSNLVRLTKTKYRLEPANKRTQLSNTEIEIRFFDYKLILDVDTAEKELIFAGLLWYKDFTKLHRIGVFDKKDIYLNLLKSRGHGLLHLRELDMLDKMFLDPITKDVLKEMGEPTDFRRLLLRANELLKDFTHEDVNGPLQSRIRGYDRVPGMLYGALVESVRTHTRRGNKNAALELDPYKVWNYITQDSSNATRTGLNPVSTLKEDEEVTLTGRGGLSSGAIPSEMRRYHIEEVGLTSEATPDSKSVAVSTYLTPFAKLENVRGFVKPGSEEVSENPSKIFSTSGQLAPFTAHDDYQLTIVPLDSDVWMESL